MSYRVDYQDPNGKWGTVIHRFTTKREAEAFAKSHMAGCNRLGIRMTATKVVKDSDPPDMGWLHGRLVHLYPMNF
jgi:hypothetical protein